MRFRHLVLVLSTVLVAFFVAVPAVMMQVTVAQDTSQDDAQSVLHFQTVGAADRWLFDLEMEPGEEVSLRVAMGNAGTSAFEGTTYAADAFSMVNGGYAIRDRDAERTGVTTWLEYPTETFIVEPGQGIEREFTISVPEDATPGEYVSGLAWETMDDEIDLENEDATGFQLQTYHRILIGVRIVVPGELAPSIELGDPVYTAGPPLDKITVPIANTGNQRVELSGTLKIQDSSETVILEAPIQLGRIYGGHETTIELSLGGPIDAGDYTVELELSDESGTIQASLPSSLMEVSVDARAASPVDSPVQVSDVDLVAMPSAENIQYVDLSATITNNGSPSTSAQPVLVATIDGTEIERFPIGSALSLAAGDTDVTSRYVPTGGWTSGEWVFTLEVEVLDPAGAVIHVVSQPIDTTINVP